LRIRSHSDSAPTLWLLGAAVATVSSVGAAWYTDARRRDQTSKKLRRVMIDVLLNALNAGDAFTERHSRRVADLTDVLGCAFGLDRHQRARLRVASLLHDMGKIDDRFFHILHSCGTLTAAERNKIKQHPHESAYILTPMERVYPGITYIVESHHECWDGNGYPRGLKGEEIPLEARIISVADVFDAMSQPRAYKDPRSVDRVLHDIHGGSGERFDPGVVAQLERADVLRAWTEIAERGHETERRVKGPRTGAGH
jgi:HD-GYP domain-containing protein (c-di-GMP phosphodiesterase class II)